MGTPLDRIEIQGFKSIGGIDLELRPLNVLIGSNGAGKSNFISVFGLLNQIVARQLQVHVQRSGGADSLLHHGQKQTAAMVLRLHFGANGYEAKLAPGADGALFLEEERCWYQGYQYPKPYTVHLASGAKESGLEEEAKDPKNKIAKFVLSAVQSWKVYHFHDTSPSAKVKQQAELGDNAFFRPDASNLAPFLLLLRDKHSDHYRLIVESVRRVAPFFKDFQLRPNPLNPDRIQLEWTERQSDSYFNAHSLSDGTLRFICLATLLLQPSPPSTILIDEPELGLHPFAIQMLASLLKQASSRTQVIASTQSVTLVNQFTPDAVVVVNRGEGQSVFGRLRPDEIATWMDDYSLGELWEKNVLGGRPE